MLSSDEASKISIAGTLRAECARWWRMFFQLINRYFVSILRARSMTFGVRAPKLYLAAMVRHRTR
jgi:hypothetical protein